jgi:hypothetical protein
MEGLRSFLNERGHARELKHVGETIMHILEKIDLKFAGRFHQGLRMYPRLGYPRWCVLASSHLVFEHAVWLPIPQDCCAREFLDGKGPAIMMLSWRVSTPCRVLIPLANWWKQNQAAFLGARAAK